MNKRLCVSIPEKISERIDSDRGDVTRSRFVTRLLEKAYSYKEENSK